MIRNLCRIGLGALLGLGLTGQVFAAPVGTSPNNPAPLTSVAHGSIVGSSAGAYNFYTVNYPGQYVVGTLTLNFSPSDPITSSAVGLDVYQNGTEIASTNGTSGPNPGTTTTPFAVAQAGPVLVEVYNYDPGENVTYELDLSGLPVTSAPSPSHAPPAASAPAPATAPAPAAPAPTTSSPLGTASNPISLSQPRSGTLPGSPSGSYAYYTLNYSGDGSFQTVNFTFSPNGGDVANAVFVNVYQNGTLLTSVPGTDNGSLNPGQLQVLFTSTTAGPVLIQVGNYSSTPINFSISH